jgi:hypothetical protein
MKFPVINYITQSLIYAGLMTTRIFILDGRQNLPDPDAIGQLSLTTISLMELFP